MQNEFEGKTVEEAIATGLTELGLTESEVDIEVVQKGNRGIFGIGGSTAVVRITLQGTETSAATLDRTTSSSDISTTDDLSINDDVATAGVATADDVTTSELVSEPASDQSATQSIAESASTDTRTEIDKSEADFSSDELYDEISDDELAEMAMDLLGKTISMMGYDVEVTANWRDPEPGDDERCLTLDVEGEHLGALIGRRGETLDNLQYILRLMVNQKIRSWCNIVVDVASYKSRRADQLTQLANRVADQVAESGRPQSLEPMPSNERRIVHLTLREHADVYTESTGDSDRRKVHIVPKSLTS